MDARNRLHVAGKNAGGISEKKNAVVVLFCIAVVALCFVVPLLLTLPRTLDAAERTAPRAVETSSTHASEVPFHERYKVQGTEAWVDTLEETDVATVRRRASD